MSKSMHMTLCKMIGPSLQFRRYEHKRHGVVETLRAETIIFVRPVFGLAKPNEKRPSESRTRSARNLSSGSDESNGDASNAGRKAGSQSWG
jgi:hypothetical protein